MIEQDMTKDSMCLFKMQHEKIVRLE